METKPVLPDELRFAITRKCDGECRHCYNKSGKDVDKLSDGDFINLINEVHTLNTSLDRITITGGEPLKEIDKVLNVTRFARSLGIRVRLVTRGWELNRETCNALKEAGVTRIQIGLDSSGMLKYEDDHRKKWDTLHSWLRNDEMGFKKTTAGINFALQAGMDVSIRYSLCKSNINDVVGTYQFVSRLGVSKFKFRVLYPDGRAKKRLITEFIKGNDLACAQHELINASRNNKTVVEITQPCLFSLPSLRNLVQGKHPYNAFKEACPCGTLAAYIDSNGDVKYCLFDEKILGNICDATFLTIWNSDLTKKERKLRCPLDMSNINCSSFQGLYTRFGNYPAFIKDYTKRILELKI